MSTPGPIVLSSTHPSQIRPKVRDQSITFFWSAPTSDGGIPITSYTLYCTNPTLAYRTANGDVRSYEVTGLTNGTSYTFSIYASNASGNGPAATFRTVEPGFRPMEAENVTAIITGSSAVVSWDAPSSAPIAPIHWYVIKARDIDTNNIIKVSAHGYDRQKTLYLTPSSSYIFTVYAVNDPGYAPSASITVNNIVQQGLLVWLDAMDYTGYQANPLPWLNKTGNHVYDATREFGTIAKSVVGNSIVLNGTSSWEFPDIGSQANWTLSVWFKRTGAPGSEYPAIVTQCLNGGVANMMIWTRPEYNGNFAGAIYNDINTINYTTEISFPLNVWQTMVVTWNGTNFNTYVNGILIGSQNPIITPISSGQKYRIGHRWDQGDVPEFFVTGEIGQVLIYNRALRAGEVLQNYTVSAPTYLGIKRSLLFDFNSINMPPALSLSTNSNLPLGNDSYTIEVWIKMNLSDRTPDIVGWGDGGYNINILSYNNFGTPSLIVWWDISNPKHFPIPTTLVDNTWHHIVSQYDGTTRSVFVDGILAGSDVPGVAPTVTDYSSFFIGLGVTNDAFVGKMTNLRIVKGVAVYTGNFTVPPSPLTATQPAGTNINAITAGQTVLLLNVNDNPYIDSSSYGYILGPSQSYDAPTLSSDVPF